METMTNASSANGKSQRKSSAATEPELNDDQDDDLSNVDETDIHSDAEESSEEEYKEGGAQKYISPIEVQDHIKRLWAKDGQLLGLMYGRFDRTYPMRTDSMGFKQFF